MERSLSHAVHGYLALGRVPGPAWAATQLAHVNTAGSPQFVMLWRSADEEQADADLFLRIGRHAVGLDHPGVVRVRSAVTTPRGTPMWVTDFHEHRPLFDVVQACHERALDLPPGVLARVLADVVEASAAVSRHAGGMRGGPPLAALVPDDIQLGLDGAARRQPGLPLDVVRAWNGAAESLESGTRVYLAPEVLERRAASDAALVFSLGVILYECTTHALPFAGDDVAALVHAMDTEEPVRPSEINPAVAAGMERLCLAALAPEPARRPSLAECVAELRRLARTSRHPVTANHLAAIMELLFPPATDPLRSWLRGRRDRLAAMLAARVPAPEEVSDETTLRAELPAGRPVTAPSLPAMQADVADLPWDDGETSWTISGPGAGAPTRAIPVEEATRADVDSPSLAEVRAMLSEQRRKAEESGFTRVSGVRPDITWGRLTLASIQRGHDDAPADESTVPAKPRR